MSKRPLNTGCLPAIIITAFATTIIIYRSSAMLATTKDGQTIVTSVYTIIEK